MPLHAYATTRLLTPAKWQKLLTANLATCLGMSRLYQCRYSLTRTGYHSGALCRVLWRHGHAMPTACAEQIFTAQPAQSSHGCRKKIEQQWRDWEIWLGFFWHHQMHPNTSRLPPCKAREHSLQQHRALQPPGEILLCNVQTITRNILSNCFC